MDNIQQVWDDERDGEFFRLTSSCFSPTFCYGASVLLASYDPDDESVTSQPVAAPGLTQKPNQLFVFQPSQ